MLQVLLYSLHLGYIYVALYGSANNKVVALYRVHLHTYHPGERSAT